MTDDVITYNKKNFEYFSIPLLITSVIIYIMIATVMLMLSPNIVSSIHNALPSGDCKSRFERFNMRLYNARIKIHKRRKMKLSGRCNFGNIKSTNN